MILLTLFRKHSLVMNSKRLKTDFCDWQ